MDIDTTRARELAASLTEHPQQIEVKGRMGLSQEELFDVIVDFDSMSGWLPMARRTWTDNSKAEIPGGVGAVRMIDAGAPKVTRETVVAIGRPDHLCYSANDGALMGMMTDHLSVITMEPHPEGGSSLVWLAFAKPSSFPPMAWMGRKVFGFVLRGALKNLQKMYPL